jgi:hypothetical protein
MLEKINSYPFESIPVHNEHEIAKIEESKTKRCIQNVSEVDTDLTDSITQKIIKLDDSEFSKEFLDKELAPSIEIYHALYNQWGMKIADVSGDGNCFFHAVAAQLQLIRGEEVINHQKLRTFAIYYIRHHRVEFQDFIIDETIEAYLDRMSRNREWADHNIIQALSRELRINIVIIGSNHIDKPIVVGAIEYERTIYLGHIVELHYVSLEKIDDDVARSHLQLLEIKVQQELSRLYAESSEQSAEETVGLCRICKY